MDNLIIWLVFIGDFIASAIMGFMHGGVLGYFIGILNTLMLLAMLVIFGFQIGKDISKKELQKWSEVDDKLTKEDTGL